MPEAHVQLESEQERLQVAVRNFLQEDATCTIKMRSSHSQFMWGLTHIYTTSPILLVP